MALAYLLSNMLGLQERSPAPAPLPEPDTRTLVSYAFVTPSITISGPYILVTMTPGNPLAAAVTTATPTPTTTRRATVATTQRTSSTSSTESDDTTSESSAQSSTDSSDGMTPSATEITSSIATTAANTVAAAPTQSTAASLTPGLNQVSVTQAASAATATATEPQKGMSGGAVAGLIFGLLLGIGAIVGLVILLYKRKKKEQGSYARQDDEKAFTSRPDALPQHPLPVMTHAAATSPSFNQRAMAQTPATSQFGSHTPITPVAAGGVAAAGIAASSRGAPSPMSTLSAWERPGSSRVNDPENPFGNHAELSTTPPKSSLSVNTAAAPAPTSAGPAPVELHTEPLVAPGPINAADFPLPQSMPGSPASTIAPKPSVPAALIAGGAAAVAGAAVAGAAATGNKEPEAKVHRVQMDFAPSMDDELAIRTGQLVKIQHEYDDGWALVGYMDGSKSGVVPRTCLSKNALKPHPQNGPASPNHRSGPGLRPNGGPRSMTPQGRNSPAPFAQVPRPLTPTGRSPATPSGPPPAPFAQMSRPGSAASSSTGSRQRSQSNAAMPYVAYAPQGAAPAESSSPSFGAGQLKPTPRPDNLRRRSNSVSAIDVKKASAAVGEAEPPILMSPLGQMPTRKPVGGAAAPASPPAPST